MKDKKNYVIFDFDGTLIKEQSTDLFCIFILYKLGHYKNFLIALFYMSFFYKIICFFRNKDYYPKFKILKLLSNVKKNDFLKNLKEFHVLLNKKKIDEVVFIMYKHLINNDKVYVITSAYNIYLETYLPKNVNLIATKLKFNNNLFSGYIEDTECSGKEKVKLFKKELKEELNDIKKITFYTDSESDKPFLEFSDENFIVSNHNNNEWSKRYKSKIIRIKKNKFKLKVFLKFLYSYLLPDFLIISIKCFITSRKIPNLIFPKKFNDKILWLKLNFRKDWHFKYADKILAKNIVSQKVGHEYVVPNIKIFDNFQEFVEIIPEINPPYIIKLNHDCGGGYIIKNKSELNSIKLIKSINTRLKKNYFFHTKEYQYKKIKPKVFVETLLQNESGSIPNDYKFHMINGEVSFIYCTVDREGLNYRRIYSPDWKYANFVWAPYNKHLSQKYNGPEIDKPRNYLLMEKIAKKLSTGFPYIRIDFYEVGEKVFVGEFTLHHEGGNSIIKPDKYEFNYGKLLNLTGY